MLMALLLGTAVRLRGEDLAVRYPLRHLHHLNLYYLYLYGLDRLHHPNLYHLCHLNLCHLYHLCYLLHPEEQSFRFLPLSRRLLDARIPIRESQVGTGAWDRTRFT
jgi:hypothetical protein